MADFEIVLTETEGPSRRYRVDPAGLTLGRNADNDVNLPSNLVSRRHARLWVDNKQLKVEDLESRNGILVNGHPVKKSVLREGDVLSVGESQFRVVKCSDSTFGNTIISKEKAEKVYQSMVSADGHEQPPVLYRAAQLLGSIFDIDELLEQILALIFEALPVRRGFVLTVSAETGNPEINATRSNEEEEQGPPLSNNLIQYVFDKKEAMLTVNAQEDSRLDLTESIVTHNIHSAMCAPLSGREAVVGVIYVDSGTLSKPFKKADLELLTAITRVVGVAVENARLYQENVESERLAAIGQATAGLGHCVKNILTGIRGGSEFIDMALEKEDLGYVKRGWPIMSRAIERIDVLVMNMLTFSRNRQPERISSDVNGLVRDVMEVLRNKAEKANVAMEFTPDPDGRAKVDPREIYRVILNLVMNAIEACEQKNAESSVTISTLCNDAGCTIEVADTGTGIPAELLPQLSKAFVSTKGSSGTGLGLACSYKIVGEHDGQIEVQSEVGKGTTFVVFLPAVSAEARQTNPIMIPDTSGEG